MAEFPSNSNQDCIKCGFSIYVDDGGGDYEDMIWKCMKVDQDVGFIRADNKPCGLPKGKNYIATYSINDNNETKG